MGRVAYTCLIGLLLGSCGPPPVARARRTAPRWRPATAPPEKDSDRDSIPDARDKCPRKPEDRDQFEDDDGCPDPDNDRDGIPDVRDKCPNLAEVYNHPDKTPQTADGCPGTAPFRYCALRRLRLVFGPQDRLTPASARQLGLLFQELKRRGVGNHHIFWRPDPKSARGKRRWAAIRAVGKPFGSAAERFRSRYEATGCCTVHPRTCRQERAFYHGLKPGDPTLVLVRVQTKDCPK